MRRDLRFTVLIREDLKLSNHLQMKLQRQHFLLSYFKILSVDPAGVRTRDPPDLPRDSPTLNQLVLHYLTLLVYTKTTVHLTDGGKWWLYIFILFHEDVPKILFLVLVIISQFLQFVAGITCPVEFNWLDRFYSKALLQTGVIGSADVGWCWQLLANGSNNSQYCWELLVLQTSQGMVLAVVCKQHATIPNNERTWSVLWEGYNP